MQNQAVKFVIKTTLATLLGVTLLSACTSQADAATGFLRGQYRDGSDTHCIYDAMGHKYDINIGFGICDLTIETND